jgi:membrane-bound ClpP family serine protease
MSVTLIIILILLGILLFIIEFLLIPGIGIAGIIGAVLMIGGVILGYNYHGITIGNIILASTVVLSVITLVLVLKSKTWKKVMLNTKIEGKVNSIEKNGKKLNIGDLGTTITRLNPMGKVLIGGQYYEAQALNMLIDEGTEIIITKISGKKIIVEPKK